MTPKRTFKEQFASFLEAPSRQSLREFVRNHVGEMDHADFKADWPIFPKVAKHVLAIANSGGGLLIFGLREQTDGTVSAEGLATFNDKADIGRALAPFLPKTLQWDVLNVEYAGVEYGVLDGKKFQLMVVESSPRALPYVCEQDGDKLRRGAVYVRRNTESVEADYDEIQAVISRRVASGYDATVKSRLVQELEELTALYDARPTSHAVMLEGMASLFGGNKLRELDIFVNELIEKKKRAIRRLIDNGGDGPT